MYQYPYGNAQQLNLDWLIEQWQEVKQSIDGSLQGEIDRVEAAITDLLNARDAAVAAANAANASAGAAASSANTAAAQSAISTAQAAAATQERVNAANAANNAQTYANNALAQAVAAGNYAGNASTSANQAAASASDAHDDALAAAGSASDAHDDALSAAGSASDAHDDALSAAQSAQDAQTVLDTIPSNAYPVVEHGAVINAHPVPTLTINKRGSTFKITGNRGSLGITLNLLNSNFDILSPTNYASDNFITLPDISDICIAAFIKGTIGSTLSGERIAVGIAEFTENPSSGESNTPTERRLSINTENIDACKIFPLTAVKGKKVRPVTYLRANGTYDVEITFEIIFPNTAAQSMLQGLLLENI